MVFIQWADLKAQAEALLQFLWCFSGPSVFFIMEVTKGSLFTVLHVIFRTSLPRILWEDST